MKLAGIVLVILGIVGLSLARLHGPPKEKVVDLGPLQSRTTRPSLPLPRSRAEYA